MTAIDESLTAKGYTPAAQVAAVFGQKRTIDGIIIHHWGDRGQTHDGVVNFFVNGPGQTSAHYVVSAGRINCIVSPWDAAWHCPGKNATTIGIECRPEATDEDYATVAELVALLRTQYGPLPLSKHRDWYATACPGVWDLDRINTLANGSAAAGAITTQGTTNQSEEDDLTPEQAAQLAYIAGPQFKADIFTGASDLERGARNAFHKEALNTDIPWFGYDGKQPTEGRTTTTPAVAAGYADASAVSLHGAIAALSELVKQLSIQQGVTIDYQAIAKAVNDNAAQRMAK